MWWKSGSDNGLTYQEAQAYIDKLNRQKFAGYDDWRLPTIPELMSLLEPERQSNSPYIFIDSIFDSKQRRCWSADKRPSEKHSSGSAWYVNFERGFVSWLLIKYDVYVRAVRSWKETSLVTPFVLKIESNLPHKIPDNYSDGLWVSSVPMKLDVLVFPESFTGPQHEFVEKVDRGENAAPYYVGKTPLYVKLQPGTYKVVIFHSPLGEIDTTYQQEWEEKKEKSVGGFGIRSPKNPFIGPNTLMAVEGRYFWSVVRTIEIGAELKTVIGLFQRKDKHLSYLFPLLPNEESFGFTMKAFLRDFSKFFPKIGGGIPEDEIENAMKLLHRGGVFGWEIGDGHNVVIEITGENDTFTVTTSVPSSDN